MVENKYTWMVSREFYNQTPTSTYVTCCSISLPPLLSPLMAGGTFRGQLWTSSVPWKFDPHNSSHHSYHQERHRSPQGSSVPYVVPPGGWSHPHNKTRQSCITFLSQSEKKSGSHLCFSLMSGVWDAVCVSAEHRRVWGNQPYCLDAWLLLFLPPASFACLLVRHT